MKCKSIFLVIVSLVCIAVIPVKAQVEGYGSVSYGFHKNPLYNYQEYSDNLRQSYVELRYNNYYDYSDLDFLYTGGLMMFNRFSDRDYYEHSLGGNYSFQFLRDDDDEDTSQIFNSMTLGASANARLDKDVHKEYDNYALNLNASYKNINNGLAPYELSNNFSFRNYSNLGELSNVSDILELKAGLHSSDDFNYGLKISGGIKYYTQTVYDTSQFENKRTVVSHGQGRGKPGAIIYSNKKILIEPQSNGIHQFTVGMYLSGHWQSFNVSGEVKYRYNALANTRYLAQYVNTTFLSEDIYNDFFSYEGPASNIKANIILPWSFRFALEAAAENKKFNVPALDLNGEQTAAQREDLLLTSDFALTRSFEKEIGINIELSLNYQILRNQSNDQYNDFSGSFASINLGIGF